VEGLPYSEREEERRRALLGRRDDRDVEGHGLHIHCLSEFVTTLCRSCEGWPRFVVSPEMCRTPICSTYTSTINNIVLDKFKQGLMVPNPRSLN